MDFEALGRYHDAMKRARVLLTERDQRLGALREALVQLLMPQADEFVVGGEALQALLAQVQTACEVDASLATALATAAETAGRASEAAPGVARAVHRALGPVAAVALAEPVTVIAHDAARDVSVGN